MYENSPIAENETMIIISVSSNVYKIFAVVMPPYDFYDSRSKNFLIHMTAVLCRILFQEIVLLRYHLKICLGNKTVILIEKLEM